MGGDRCELKFDSLAPPQGPEAIAEMAKSLRAESPSPSSWEGISCERGVWFTANANKGSVLRRLLPPRKHVIFADDSLRHVNAVRTALDGHAASVAALHFTSATTVARERLDTASCERAIAGHMVALFAEGDAGLLSIVRE